MSPLIRPCRPADDAAAIARIYNYYIRETFVTFEVDEVSGEAMEERVAAILESYPYVVAEDGEGSIVGYAYAGRWHVRAAYAQSVEVSVYLAPEAAGAGLGTALYKTLIEELRARGFHVAIGGIALPNDASVRLHEKLGFEKAAHYREVGRKFDRWIDVGYWELIL